jgi:hypothetical protein
MTLEKGASKLLQTSETVLHQLQKSEDLSVCSGASTMNLVSALCVKNCCACDTGTFRELRKGNVYRWKPVPEDWWEDSRLLRLSAGIVNCWVCETELDSKL